MPFRDTPFRNTPAGRLARVAQALSNPAAHRAMPSLPHGSDVPVRQLPHIPERGASAFLPMIPSQHKPLPSLPADSSQSASEAQRAWKTILEGGTLGNVKNVIVGEQAQLVTVAGPDDQAEVMTVTLIPPLIPGGFGTLATSTGHEPAFAVIQWGVAGGVCNAEVDYGRGCSFAISASAVRIFAVREPDVGAIPSPVLQLGASICKGAIASPIQVTRSFNTDVAFPAGMLPGNTSTVTIPPYAKFVTIYSTPVGAFPGPDGSQPMTISLNEFNGPSVFKLRTALNQVPPRIELPNDASLMFVINDSALNTVRQAYVFDLAL